MKESVYRKHLFFCHWINGIWEAKSNANTTNLGSQMKCQSLPKILRLHDLNTTLTPTALFKSQVLIDNHLSIIIIYYKRKSSLIVRLLLNSLCLFSHLLQQHLAFTTRQVSLFATPQMQTWSSPTWCIIYKEYGEYSFPTELFSSSFIFLQTISKGLFLCLCISSTFFPNPSSTTALQQE